MTVPAGPGGADRPGRPPSATTPGRRPWSLRWRLLAATLAAVAMALLLAGWVLAGLFGDHVTRQFDAALRTQLDQVTARLEFDDAGLPRLDSQRLSDPRWSRPYAGLYWQVDRFDAGGLQRGVLRSRSLWDAELATPADPLADGAVHTHRAAGPLGAPLLMVERTVRVGGGGDGDGDGGGGSAAGDPSWRLVVAGDLRETEAAIARFNGVLAGSLAALLALLAAAAAAQVGVGLAPLRSLQRALAAVHGGRAARLDGRFPAEVQPLIDDFNAVLDRNAEVVARARTQAGNLAHAIKTPLAALAQAADAAGRDPQRLAELAPLVREQVAVARRHVDWHLARARAAAAQGVPGLRAELAPVVAGLARVMARVHAGRGVDIDLHDVPAGLAFAGERQDLEEMLGNVLDNACQWARRDVRVTAALDGAAATHRMAVVVDDDGPGIPADRRAIVTARGARLDESVPGSGLGLAIVQELVALYGGSMALEDRPGGGLRVRLVLPAAPGGAG
jgi:signal transduction histidine kinase